MSRADIIVISILAIAVAAAIIYIVKCRKKGKCVGCSGDCSTCTLFKKERKRQKAVK